MRTEQNGKHARVIFDSFADIVDFHRDCAKRGDDHCSQRMRYNDSFHDGAKSIAELVKLADTGMPREGIDALGIAENALRAVEQDLVSQQFQSFYDVSGSDVDVARYLSGEPENMISYVMDDRPQTQRVITLVVALGVAGGMSTRAIRKRGQYIVALAEAIDRTGLQSEIWAEFTTGYPNKQRDGYTARIQVRLKSPGEMFDTGMFMFALTHAGFYRGFLFNACHQLQPVWQSKLGIGANYGRCVFEFIHPEDYPDGCTYIDISHEEDDAETAIRRILGNLGLLAD